MADHTIIAVFLRGAMDGLSFLVPYRDEDYAAARPDIAIPANRVLELDGTFGLHPAAAPLGRLWDQRKIAFIPASGSTDPSRSHFDAMALMEAASGDDRDLSDGWLSRHLQSSKTGETLEAVGIGRLVPKSMLGLPTAIGLQDLETFSLGAAGGRTAGPGIERAVRTCYADPASGLLGDAGIAAFGVLDELAANGLDGSPTPPEFGTQRVGSDFWQAAQLLNADIGVRGITIDSGGWDLHDAAGTVDGGRMVDQLDPLTTAISAFWDAIPTRHDDVTVVVMTEFGRRVQQNTNGGTDHGHASVMTVLGGGVSGGVFGEWPGLAAGALDRGDVAVTTDYRVVLAEVVDRLAGNASNLATVFPEFDISTSDYLGVAG